MINTYAVTFLGHGLLKGYRLIKKTERPNQRAVNIKSMCINLTNMIFLYPCNEWNYLFTILNQITF